MPNFLPFRGVHYDLDVADLALVTSPPYDVVDGDDRSRLAALDPTNAVVLDLPTGDGDRYLEAGATLRRWMATGTLVQDRAPSFYIYRMETIAGSGRCRTTTGVFGALELSRPGEGGILPHERTTPKARSDRLNLLRGTRANLSAVWCLSPTAGLSSLLDLETPSLADWTDGAGVRHQVWTTSEPERLAAISEAVGAGPLVIADGHHRYETSLAYRDEQRQAGAGRDAPSESTLAYVVELVDTELNVLPIHRLITGLPAGVEFPLALEPWFVPSPAGTLGADAGEQMASAGALVVVTAKGAWFLRPRPGLSGIDRDLDSVRLEVALAGLPAHELTYQHGIDQVLARVASGEAQAGLLLRPASVDQIVHIAKGGERMPPKTTFFEPKPLTGVVFRLLED